MTLLLVACACIAAVHANSPCEMLVKKVGCGDVWVRRKCKDVCSGATVASRGDALSALLGARDEGAERADANARDRAVAAEQRANLERIEAAESLVAVTATAAARSASAARDAMLSLHAAFEHASKSQTRDVRKATADVRSHASASEEAARQALRGVTVARQRDHIT